MKLRRINLSNLGILRKYYWLLALVAAVLTITIAFAWLVHLSSLPTRRVSPTVSLEGYGIPGVELKVVYPVRLSPAQDVTHPAVITVLVRAYRKDAVRPLELAFSLSDGAISFVDTQGKHIPGRLKIVAGYPDALPYDLRIAHENTQLRGGFWGAHRVEVLPVLREGDRVMPIEELGFQVRLEGPWARAYRAWAVSIIGLGVPVLFLGGVALFAVWGWRRWRERQQLLREKQLVQMYMRLREQIKLERWAEARAEIERIRKLQPHYRDVDRLETLVSTAEMAAWRREQLYQMGIRAYKRRDWPAAVQAFRAIEEEAPYYRDVRFLRRTAALYADLQSRDRSLRIAAAKGLGEVADLVDMEPLLQALGDHSDEVADAAEEAFRRIGLAAFETLLGGLRHESLAARKRAYRLLEGLGQSVREQLLAALHSPDPQITRPVARLLASLGAREELAKALLWAAPEHQEGIVEALLREGVAACNVLLEALLQAPAERQQVVINALAALKEKVEIDRRIEKLLRASKDPARKELLQRALNAPPAPFRVGGQAPAPKVFSEVPKVSSSKKPRRFHLLDRRRS
ncbi:MAG: hypothetical protein J7M05_04275 [Anaerolineae bacterium]|nr:hypothetical protein [Anaerolineae bacterium]